MITELIPAQLPTDLIPGVIPSSYFPENYLQYNPCNGKVIIDNEEVNCLIFEGEKVVNIALRKVAYDKLSQKAKEIVRLVLYPTKREIEVFNGKFTEDRIFRYFSLRWKTENEEGIKIKFPSTVKKALKEVKEFVHNYY